MPDFGIYAGDTSKTIYLRLRDSTTGLAKTGLLYNSTGAVCSYTLPGAARAAITLATLASASAAWSSGGFILVDDTNCKGLYRLDLPNAAIASGAFTIISIEFDGVIEESINVPLHTPNVNVTEIGGSAQSMTDLKDFADAGYDPATNKVQGVVLADTVTTLTGHTAQTGDSFARLGAPAAASVSADIATVDANVDTLLARITSTLFSGITSVAEWLGAMAGKQAPDATAQTEIRATGAGSGTFDATTESQEAIRDRGDSSWVTGAGGTGLSALAEGTAQAGGTSTQIILASSSTFADNILNGNVVNLLTGTGAGQSRIITANVLSGDICTVYPAWTTNPDATTTYEIVQGSTNIGAVSLDGAAADNLELDYDGTGYNKANSTIGTVTALASTALDAIVSTATGMVEIAKAIWDRVLTGATHNIANSAGRRLRGLNDFGLYEGGSVWIDTVNGTAGTTDFENGTVNNPVDTIADANTLASSIGLPSFHVVPGSTITLAATQNSQLFMGHGWTLALGGQDINNSHFFDCAVSGIGTAATEMEFHDCEIGTGSFQKAHFYGCTFDGTATFTLAGDYHLINCQSGVAGAGAPTFTKTAGQAVTAEFRRWSGGVTFSGIESTDTLTISGELGTVTLNGADGTVEIRGTYKAIVDNRTGSPTLNIDGAILAADVAAILVDTGTTIPATLGTPAADVSADIAAVKAETASIQAETTPILADTNELQADWTNGGRLDVILDAIKVITDALGSTAAANLALSAGASGIVVGAAEAGTLSTTVMTSDLAEATDDHYIGRVIIWTSGVLAGQATDITDYSGTAGTLTYTAVTEAPGAGDAFIIV